MFSGCTSGHPCVLCPLIPTPRDGMSDVCLLNEGISVNLGINIHRVSK